MLRAMLTFLFVGTWIATIYGVSESKSVIFYFSSQNSKDETIT